jgi:hypothetical protein
LQVDTEDLQVVRDEFRFFARDQHQPGRIVYRVADRHLPVVVAQEVQKPKVGGRSQRTVNAAGITDYNAPLIRHRRHNQFSAIPHYPAELRSPERGLHVDND